MTPSEIVDKMLQNDRFSNWLGIEVNKIELGYCRAKMAITADMLNGMNIAHGGISFSFADSVFAFASNSHGQKAVSIETSISHLRPSKVGDHLFAEAIELHLGKTTSIYEVTIINQDNKKVALFKGTAFRTTEKWE